MVVHTCNTLPIRYLKYVLQFALDHCPDDMAFFDKLDKNKPSLLTRLKHVIETPFKRITYTEAIEALIKSGKKFEIDPVWGIDMGSEHERYLTEQVFKMPIIVTVRENKLYNVALRLLLFQDYPKSFKAFYMRMNDDGKTVAAMDVLVPRVGEIIGGSQREERMDVLLKMYVYVNVCPVLLCSFFCFLCSTTRHDGVMQPLELRKSVKQLIFSKCIRTV